MSCPSCGANVGQEVSAGLDCPVCGYNSEEDYPDYDDCEPYEEVESDFSIFKGESTDFREKRYKLNLLYDNGNPRVDFWYHKDYVWATSPEEALPQLIKLYGIGKVQPGFKCVAVQFCAECNKKIGKRRDSRWCKECERWEATCDDEEWEAALPHMRSCAP